MTIYDKLRRAEMAADSGLWFGLGWLQFGAAA